MTSSVADAYDATGGAWQEGPGRVYDRLAEVLVAACLGVRPDAVVLDLGAGTGAASRAAAALGARVVAVDAAFGMLAADASGWPPGVVGDALALPFAPQSFDAVVAAFSLNHVADPAAALGEAHRVLRPGGSLVASAYADDDSHPVKAAVEAAAAAAGWTPAPWYESLRAEVVPLLATVERARGVAARSRLAADTVVVERRRVPFPDLGPEDLVAWRLGMAQLAPFVAGLPPAGRRALAADAVARLGADAPPLVRSIIVLTATRLT